MAMWRWNGHSNISWIVFIPIIMCQDEDANEDEEEKCLNFNFIPMFNLYGNELEL